VFAFPSADDRQSPPTLEPVGGRYRGDLLVGDGRYPLLLELHEEGASNVVGSLSGALAGRVAGRVEQRSIVFQVPFSLSQEACTGTLRGEVERANRGRMLVGPVLLTRGCSDGKEEVGVIAVRRTEM
jgi:hypothetical protein